MLRGHLTRTRLGLVLAVGAASCSAPSSDSRERASRGGNAKPTPKTLPTISGTAEVGVTLVGDPRNLEQQARRHSTSPGSGATRRGDACLAISGATAKIYTPTSDRHRPHAPRGGDGAEQQRIDTATSAATGDRAAERMSGRSGTIRIDQLTPPARLDDRERIGHAGA